MARFTLDVYDPNRTVRIIDEFVRKLELVRPYILGGHIKADKLDYDLVMGAVPDKVLKYGINFRLELVAETTTGQNFLDKDKEF